MMKKAIALVSAGAILLTMVGSVFAHSRKDIAIIKNNDVTAVANTGSNSQSNVADVNHGGGVDVGGGGGDRLINTGDAHAKAKGAIVANTHVSCDGCGCWEPRHKDVAVVKGNDVGALADTGYNAQDNYALVRHGGGVDVGGGGGERTIRTGDAWAKAKGYVVVNTHLSLD